MENGQSELPRNPQIEVQEVVYENPYQQVRRVLLDFGPFTKELFVNDHGERVGVIVEGPEGMLLTRQYRHLIDRISWEIPGGRVDPGEDKEAAACRECLEETGISCHGLKPLLMFHPGLDTLHNPTYLFCAASFKQEAGTRATRTNETCGLDWVPLERCLAMISSREIVDSLSIIALLSYSAFMKRK